MSNSLYIDSDAVFNMEANTDANRDSSEDSNEDAGKDFNKGSNKASNKDSDEGANSKTGLALGAKETAKSDIVIENLTTGYDKKAIIDHLNLTIPRGKITTLIGANGCGKSTLLKTICRIIKPMNGAVYLDGTSIHDVPTHELAKKLAILPQHPTAPEGLTVRELISYGRAPYRNGIFSKVNKEDKAYVDWALEITHLKELADRPIHSLSGGQRQRAWIAMAVAQDTDILFLDEPTSFLDIAHQLEVLQLVDYLNTKFGKTIVMVLHELNQAARFADNIIAMKAGEVRFQGTPEDVITDEMLRDVFNITAMIMRDPVTRMPFCIPQYVGGGL